MSFCFPCPADVPFVLSPRHDESGFRSPGELEQHACLDVLVVALGKLLTSQGAVLRCKVSQKVPMGTHLSWAFWTEKAHTFYDI